MVEGHVTLLAETSGHTTGFMIWNLNGAIA